MKYRQFVLIPRVREILDRLDAIEEARKEVVSTGQSRTFTGSHAVTMARLDELRAEAAELKKELMILAIDYGVPIRPTGGKKGVKYE